MEEKEAEFTSKLVRGSILETSAFFLVSCGLRPCDPRFASDDPKFQQLEQAMVGAGGLSLPFQQLVIPLPPLGSPAIASHNCSNSVSGICLLSIVIDSFFLIRSESHTSTAALTPCSGFIYDEILQSTRKDPFLPSSF